jgi:hypothetical protein
LKQRQPRRWTVGFAFPKINKNAIAGSTQKCGQSPTCQICDSAWT